MKQLEMWTIYRHPKDYPLHFVVRKHVVDGAGSRPTPDFSLHGTLDEARGAIPPYRYNLGRYAEDEPQIVETWI